MFTSRRLRLRSRAALLLLPLLASACTDSNPVAPALAPSTPSEALAALQCTVDVPSATMSCTSPDGAAGSAASFVRTVGGQNRHVRLANSNNVSDGTTFQTDVTIQNLTQQALGIDSVGDSTKGIKVFFFEGPEEPVTVANPTGYDMFTAANQPYFQYNEVLQPNEISQPMTWVFNTQGTTSFSFVVYVQAAQPNGDLEFADRTWTGDSSTVWSYGPNWKGGVAPDSASSVLIPTISLVPSGRMPVLSGDVQITNLNVGIGSSLNLGAYTLTAWGNVDALGTITSGTLWMRGSGALLGGNLPGVRISGGTALQRATKATAAVSISDGSLVVSGSNSLSISIP
ncbi:MAG TPA: hypothetical protein VLK84_32645 [Longimicrobium sp.]|nr:hypothetical protein [Longimicrobium sp.]